MILKEEGRFQLGHHVIKRHMLKSDLPGYIIDGNSGPWFTWISENPTHIYDHEKGSAEAIDGMVYLQDRLDLKLVGPRYKTLEELRASLDPKPLSDMMEDQKLSDFLEKMKSPLKPQEEKPGLGSQSGYQSKIEKKTRLFGDGEGLEDD